MTFPSGPPERSALCDPARRNALLRSGLLTHVPLEAFQRLVNLAAHLIHAPSFSISLADCTDEFLLAATGDESSDKTSDRSAATDARSRFPSFTLCRLIATQNCAVRVDDAMSNTVFSGSEAGAFLGVPVRAADGVALGMFAACDSEPRLWSDEETALLSDLAAMASTEIALRLAADTERRLVEDESRQREVIERLTSVVFQTDAAGRLTFLNAAWEDLTGFTVAESLGQGALEYLAGEDVPDCHDLFIASESPTFPRRDRLRQEMRIFRKDGSYRWIELCASRTDGNEGRSGTSGTMSDVTERYESLKRLAENEFRFRTVVECLGEGLIITDLEDRVQYLNSRMAELTGYSPRELFGRPAYELLLPPAEWEKMRLRTRSRAEGTSEQYQICLQTKDDRPLWVEVQATPYFDVSGAIVGVLSACSDITARKEAEARLREITVELRQSNDSLQEFASVASHDLQEPLRKIQAFGDRLQKKCEQALGAEGLDYVARMQGAAGRMQSLINDLLLYSRVATKGQPFEAVDLNGIVRGVCREYATRLNAANGSIEVGPLPTVAGDSQQLSQLFHNLIDNAVKFHREDQPPLITVRCQNVDGTPAGYRVTVSDNGIGFDSAHAERIFEVFERLNGRSDFEGTGMGLAICRRIVERHGGNIHAVSEFGNGAQFIIDLPVVPFGEPGNLRD